MSERYYLGFDLSTQQLKCLAIDDNLEIIHCEIVEFDKELPHYSTKKGIYINGDVVDCPVAMWFEAIDLVFAKYVKYGFPMDKIVGISGSCQQHGSVYWSGLADSLLKNLNPSESLVSQLAPQALSRKTAPNWQDHSTGEQCQEMENTVGGTENMAQITGSKAHYRFTGPQILKIAENEKKTYEDTQCIALVSSFLQSVLCGKLTQLEEADACGMNLYDVENHSYDDKLISLINSKTGNNDLSEKLLGEPICCAEKPIWSELISKYFTDKYQINPSCKVFPFTGDNLATICSLPLQKNDVLVSMGTSTTVLMVTDTYHPSPNYHMFVHPTIPNNYMAMICYCNGALAREEIRNALNKNLDCDWNKFNEQVLSNDQTTENEIGVYFSLGEIIPNVEPVYKRAKFDPKTGDLIDFVDHFNNDSKNIVQSQALSCRVRITPLLSCDDAEDTSSYSNEIVKFDYSELPLSTYVRARPNRVFFVGGTAKNDAIVKKYAEILGAENGNFRFANTSNSCALGGCYKAIWSHSFNEGKTSLEFGEYLNKKFNWNELEHFYDSNKEEWEAYSKFIKPLSLLEASL